MMGRTDQPQKPLFYAFNLDDLVPQDHLLRKVDRFLDLSDLRMRVPRQRRRVAMQETTAGNSEAYWSLTTLALRSHALVGARIDELQQGRKSDYAPATPH